MNNNGTEQTTAVFDFTPVINKVYTYVITITDHEVEFWIDNVLYAEITRSANVGAVVYA